MLATSGSAARRNILVLQAFSKEPAEGLIGYRIAPEKCNNTPGSPVIYKVPTIRREQ
jgi:hypothetical protein